MTSSGVDGRVAALAAQVGERAGRAAWPGEIAALDLACRAAGALRQKDFIAAGVHQQYVSLLARIGVLVRVSRGCYSVADAAGGAAWQALAVAAMRWPGSAACGPAAAAFHGLGPDDPDAVWIAIARGRGRPRGTIGGRQVAVREWLPSRMEAGVRPVQIGGVTVLVATPEYAVAELMEMSSRIGARRAYDAARAFVNAGGDRAALRGALDDLHGRRWRDFAISALVMD